MTLEAYLAAINIMRLALKCKPWDIRVCVSPDWHRREWRYIGKQRFICGICFRLESEVA